MASPPASTRLGTAALRIHFGGFLLFGLFVLFAQSLKNDAEYFAVVGVGVGIAGGTWLWSQYMRAQALMAGEPVFWPGLLFAISMIELIGLSIWLIVYGVPVFLAGFIFSSLFSRLWIWRKEKVELRQSKPPWSPAERYRKRVRCNALIFGITLFTILPVALRAYVMKIEVKPVVYTNPYYQLSSWLPASFDLTLVNPDWMPEACVDGRMSPQARHAIFYDPSHPDFDALFIRVAKQSDIPREITAEAQTALQYHLDAIPLDHLYRMGRLAPYYLSGEELSAYMRKNPNLSLSFIDGILFTKSRFTYSLWPIRKELEPYLIDNLGLCVIVNSRVYETIYTDNEWDFFLLKQVEKSSFTANVLMNMIKYGDHGLIDHLPNIRASFMKKWETFTEIERRFILSKLKKVQKPLRNLILSCALAESNPQSVRRVALNICLPLMPPGKRSFSNIPFEINQDLTAPFLKRELGDIKVILELLQKGEL